MYSKKKPAKIMINGWRSDSLIVGELKMLELSEIEKHGDSFIKAELMDEIIRLGMDSYKAGWVQSVTASPVSIGAVSPPAEKPRAKAKLTDAPDKYDLTAWPELPEVQLFKDWIKAKKRAKGSITQSTMNKVGKELHIAASNGFSVNDCLATAESAAWRGFEAMWMKRPDTKVKRHSFMELAAGQHLESLPNQQALAAPSYMDEFAALEHKNSEGG